MSVLAVIFPSIARTDAAASCPKYSVAFPVEVREAVKSPDRETFLSSKLLSINPCDVPFAKAPDKIERQAPPFVNEPLLIAPTQNARPPAFGALLNMLL